jgi:MOSC domain-containing protein YiiM
MGDPQFPKRFLASCNVGFYLRVLEEGEVGAGDAIEAVRIDPSAMTIRDMTYLRFFDCDNREGVERALGMPALSAAWRQSFEERLAKAGVNTEPRNTTT